MGHQKKQHASDEVKIGIVFNVPCAPLIQKFCTLPAANIPRCLLIGVVNKAISLGTSAFGGNFILT